MDHDKVVRGKMTEKYLLEELEPEVRDEFEEHFFECPECALDVRAGSEFVTHSKIVLAESAKPIAVRATVSVPSPLRRGWSAWLRPAFSLPLLALLLAGIGYQNLVVLPQLRQAATEPRVLPATAVNLLTYGANASPLVIRAGEDFLLNVIVPPDHRYASYKAELYGPAGKLEDSVRISASANDTWPIRFSGAGRQSGTYKLMVHGVTASGQNVEVGSSSFQLEIQK
jgi:hypothetical protein